ncbi:MAG: hypothetical protein ACKESB_03675 [Candidatus Hodgkinia cicadicola]
MKEADKLVDTPGCSLSNLLRSPRLKTANVTDAVFLLVVSISEDVIQECANASATKLDLWTTRVTRVCSTSEYWINTKRLRRPKPKWAFR